LSPAEQARRAKALACTMPKDNRPTCSGQVFVGIFFDGTGNNMHDDYELPPPEKRKHSNVVKLFQAFPSSKPGHYPFYIPGVGTPFPQIGDNNRYLFDINRGRAMGEKGDNRIIWAFTRLINAPHQFVTQSLLIPDAQAKTISNTVASASEPAFMRRVVFNTWQDKLKAALEGKKPFVEQINLSVFGFSRGAAEARVFVNWLFESCKQENGGWSFAGIPIRLQFLGILDTVASVGATNLYDNGVLRGHQGWADNSLEINPAVEQCVHYVAGHEIRACFPLDSVRVKSTYPSNAKEVMYPGAHSDVGGGYAPNDIGVSPKQDSLMSIIPGVNMYNEARKAGVPLLAWDELDERYRKALTPTNEVIDDFNAYLKASKIGAGPVEDLAHKHMSLYHSYRFKHLNSLDYYRTPPYVNAVGKDKNFLYMTQRRFFSNLWQLKRTVTENDPKFAQTWPFLQKYGQAIDGASRTWDELSAAPSFWEKAWNASWQGKAVNYVKNNLEPSIVALGKTPKDHAYEVAQSIDVDRVTKDIETFFDRYIHDSEAGFIGDLDEYERNGIGCVKFRTVYKGND
jgi:hypothetical protein